MGNNSTWRPVLGGEACAGTRIRCAWHAAVSAEDGPPSSGPARPMSALCVTSSLCKTRSRRQVATGLRFKLSGEDRGNT